MSLNTFQTRKKVQLAGSSYVIFHLPSAGPIETLPFSLRILLENLLRHEDGIAVRAEDISGLRGWSPGTGRDIEIAFMPSRVLLQDFTGVPCAVDLAVMRDTIIRMGGDPKKINPLQPVDLVIDHSVIVDAFGTPEAFSVNAENEFVRNRERYVFLRWTQQAFRNFRVVPPDTGIVHQVNLEYLARVVFAQKAGGEQLVYPDTLVGTDSHTTMINGLGVLGWGVGGIEAEAAMLGQPISMLIPRVIGFRLAGELRPGATATDLVLTITQMLRKKGVVGTFVEFHGPGLSALSLADRATIANMAPEYGATMGYFPVDDETLRYLRFSGRSDDHVRLVEAYCKEQGLFYDGKNSSVNYSDRLELDLATVEPSLAGPKRPQDRVALRDVRPSFRASLVDMLAAKGVPLDATTARAWVEAGKSSSAPAETLRSTVEVQKNGDRFPLGDGAVVIAAITSCTNTSNPSVMVAAGLLAKKAREKGLRSKPWVKTSLAPGSKVVTDYLDKAGLSGPLEELGFHLVGYGCTTCIGNSGPLPEPIAEAVQANDFIVAAVLSGNRNFEGRVNSQVRANYLASPPLVVAYAIAGTMDIDFEHSPIGHGAAGAPVYLRDIWPSPQEVEATIASCVKSDMFRHQYANVFDGDERWKSIQVPAGDRYQWDKASTYIKAAPFFDNISLQPQPLREITGARVLAVLGDSVTTDHISPAGSINAKGPAGQYLLAHGIAVKDFNSYGARRGNHEVMMRGTFANIRLRNLMAPGTEGGWTVHPSSKEPMSIYDAAVLYKASGTPLVILAGKEYGSGSSRDWAAKGPRLLGVRAVIAESFERIHRSNLIGMGIIPLQYKDGETRETLGLTGFETYDITGIQKRLAPKAMLDVTATAPDGRRKTFTVICRIDTPMEIDYYRNDGILQYVLRNLLKK